MELLLSHKLLTTPLMDLLKYNAGYEPTKGTLGETIDWGFLTVQITQLSKHSSMKRAKVPTPDMEQVSPWLPPLATPLGHSLDPPTL